MSTPLRKFINDVEESDPQRLKPRIEGTSYGTTKVVPFHKPDTTKVVLFSETELMASDGVTKLSEIPCRVSSDLHEWPNDLGTVSTRDSVKL